MEHVEIFPNVPFELKESRGRLKDAAFNTLRSCFGGWEGGVLGGQIRAGGHCFPTSLDQGEN